MVFLGFRFIVKLVFVSGWGVDGFLGVGVLVGRVCDGGFEI